MIRTTLRLVPASARRALSIYIALITVSVSLRAAATVLLIPLIVALFSATPASAWVWFAALTAAIAANWVVDWYTNRFGYDLGFALLNNAQHELADELTGIRLEWFTAANTSAARRAITATGPDLVRLFAYLITPIAQAVIMPVALALALVPIAWQPALVAFLGAPLLLAASYASTRITRKADHRGGEEMNAELSERVYEFARTQHALRAARRVEPARSHAGAALAAQHSATLRLVALQIPGQVLFGIATQTALVAMAATAVVLALRGDLGTVTAVALLVIVGRYLEPFVVLGDLTPAIENVAILLGHISSVLTAPRTAPSAGRAGTGREAEPGGPPLAMELQGVTFGYDPAAPVLEDLSLRFSPGTTAIVGPSGSGKTTVLGLLAGLYRPASGTVRLGTQDLWSFTGAKRREAVSVVFQHPYLFEGTIAENVRAGNPGASEAEVNRALERARVSAFTGRLPEGSATRVGEAGSRLSGGERQRISIARALLKPAPVLLIDEATSALDTENEAAVARALSAGEDGAHQIRIVVAHRLSTIRGADRVIFLDGGRVREDCTIEELLARGGAFARFWEHQQGSACWQLA